MTRRGSLLIIALLALATACAPSAAAPAHAPARASATAAELYQQGLALAELGDLTRAEQYLASALRAGHDAQRTTRALVSVCVRAARLRSAVLYAESQLAHAPRDVPLRRTLGTLYWALGEAASAERELTHALTLASDDAESHYVLALVLSAREPAAARGHFARYLALSPAGPHAEEARAALVLPAPS